MYSKVLNFMKFRPLKDQFFYKGESTDMTKPKVAFRNFAKMPKQEITWC